MDVESNPDEHEAASFLRVFKIGLIADQILPFLNLEDIKALSKSSKGVLTTIRNHPCFRDLTRLYISEDLLRSEWELTGILSYKWKHLALDLAKRVSPELMLEVELGTVLRSAESLYAYFSYGHKHSDVKSHSDRYKSASNYLGDVLERTEILRTLKLEEGLLFKLQADFWDNHIVRAKLSKVDQIEICAFKIIGSSMFLPFIGEKPERQNFSQLTKAPQAVRSFIFGRCETGSISNLLRNPGFREFIERYADSLQHLELNPDALRHLGGVRCPNLMSLSISDEDIDKFIHPLPDKFLLHQPPLLELSIVATSMNIPRGIMSLPRHGGIGSKMEKLHLEAHQFADRGPPGQQVDWQFLEGMTALKDISISIRPSTFFNTSVEGSGYAEDILNWLHPKVRKLSLVGFQHQFWRPQTIDRDVSRLLSRYQELTELTLLSNSGGVVTDDALQGILKRCDKLQSLTFGTDHDSQILRGGGGSDGPSICGITGEGFAGGVALNRLTGLLHLKIVSCPQILPESLLPIVKFRFLRSFVYESHNQLLSPSEFIFQLASQNPSLERVSVSFPNYANEDVNELGRRLKKLNSRLRPGNLWVTGGCKSYPMEY